VSRCSLKMTIFRRWPCASNISAWFWSRDDNLPLLVRAAAADLQSQRFEAFQDLDFGLEFSDGARRRRLVDDRLFAFPPLGVGCVVRSSMSSSVRLGKRWSSS